MNKIILLSFVLILCQLYSNAQDLKGTYVFDSPSSNINDDIQFKEGHKIKVKDTVGGVVTFTYFKFKKGKNTKALNDKYYSNKDSINVNGLLNNRDYNDGDDIVEEKIMIHKMSKPDFNKFTSRIYSRFKGVRAGIFTIPFKLRLDDFDFEQNVNIGMNVGFQFRINRKIDDKWLVEPIIGIGFSAINLNPKNSNLQESDGENANRTASAFSFSTGLIISLSETINIGLQYGFDYLGNNDKDVNWKYDKKPWLGVGINFGFNLSETKEANPNN